MCGGMPDGERLVVVVVAAEAVAVVVGGWGRVKEAGNAMFIQKGTHWNWNLQCHIQRKVPKKGDKK